MQVSNANDVKIYNLTSGKSVPEWISERKRRELLKKDVELSRRIELIQDFEMPGVSSCIDISPNQHYIIVAGTYKPTMRCYDVSQMSMKFERCFDNDVIKFIFLSEDYTKLMFLQQDRYVEFHNQNGNYFKLRTPKYSRDMVYDEWSCDAFIACAGSEIYRLNLERGCFLNPFNTSASMVNCCRINSKFHLLFLGTEDGKVEVWDPRVRKEVAVLDCASTVIRDCVCTQSVPNVTSLELNDPLQIGVGVNSGQVLLYDIRSHVPLLIKDHHNDLPIKDIKFHKQGELVYSLDRNVVKIWDKNSGKPYTSVLSDKPLNKMCMAPGTGLLFLANDAPKVQVHYIPSIGPAPKWCSFLDNLTEELEESTVTTIYDNYKFVTRQELESLALDHLLGSKLLRAFMHGFFIDMRLYQRAKSMIEPFSLENYKKQKIKEKLDASRESRVKVASMMSVNKELAEKLLNDTKTAKPKSKRAAKNALEDTRFQDLFRNPDFEIDRSSQAFKQLHPLLAGEITTEETSKDDDGSAGNHPLLDDEEFASNFDLDHQNNLDNSESEDDGSDDSDNEFEKIQQRRKLAQQDKERQRKPKLVFNPQSRIMTKNAGGLVADRVREVVVSDKKASQSLESRLQALADSGEVARLSSFGNRQMSFSIAKKKKVDHKRIMAVKHHEERGKIRRSASGLSMKRKNRS